MIKKYKAVYFDMDGTLIRNTNSVLFLCSINGKYNEFVLLDKMEESGELSWVEGDYKKAEQIEGLHITKIKECFDKEIKVIGGLSDYLDFLKEHGLKTVLITAGPFDVASELATRYDFDEVYGSVYEIENGIYTGKIISHLNGNGKLDCLIKFCEKHAIGIEECIAIGDSDSDVEVFRNVGYSIAINSSKALAGIADEYIETENMGDLITLLKIEKQSSNPKVD